MASRSVEKFSGSDAAQRPTVVVRGNVSPLSSSSEDVTMDEADKTLEAMGYTPVSKNRHALVKPQPLIFSRSSSASSPHGPASVSP